MAGNWMCSLRKRRPRIFRASHKRYLVGTRRAPETGALEFQKTTAATYFFAYQSVFIAAKFCHFSGRSSRAKIAVTGQTGTQAPQSMHSTGLMYSMVSL